MKKREHCGPREIAEIATQEIQWNRTHGKRAARVRSIIGESKMSEEGYGVPVDQGEPLKIKIVTDEEENRLLRNLVSEKPLSSQQTAADNEEVKKIRLRELKKRIVADYVSQNRNKGPAYQTAYKAIEKPDGSIYITGTHTERQNFRNAYPKRQKTWMSSISAREMRLRIAASRGRSGEPL